jgi:secreted trypsin-like serine protease
MEQICMNFLFVLLLQGDGGGPLTTLYCPRKLVGIVSWGTMDCAHPNYPEVYTKVSAVRKWIIDVCTAQAIPKGIIKADEIP